MGGCDSLIFLEVKYAAIEGNGQSTGKQNDLKPQTVNKLVFPGSEGPRAGHERSGCAPCAGTGSPIHAEFAARILADLQKGGAIFSFLRSTT